LPELEGLRGVAMLMVLAFHTDAIISWAKPASGVEVSLPLSFVRGGNDFGVELFFVLSSFLLSLAFIRAASGGTPVSVRRYFVRRALRILPLYYAAVLAGTLANMAQLSDLRHGVPYLFFLNSFHGLTVPLPPFNNVWWSLATEWQFYLVLPLIGGLCLTRRGRWVALAIVLGWAAAYGAWLARAWAMGSIGGHLMLAGSLFGRAGCFIGGAVAAWIFVRYGAPWRARWADSSLLQRGAGDLLVLAVLLATGVMLQWVVWLGITTAQTVPYHGYRVLQALLYSVLVGLVVMTSTHARWLLSRAPIVRLGVISYSVYLLHYPVLAYGFRVLRAAEITGLSKYSWQSAVTVVGLWTLCFVLAECTYRLIERPFLTRKEGFRA
ncbi:MAG: acyltransferase family protein, partial [Candidatus Binatia bacterium]